MRPSLLRVQLRALGPKSPVQSLQFRHFSSSTSRLAKNRVFDPVRTPSDLDTLLLIHTSRTAPLITLFSATWCRSCAHIAPLLSQLIEHEYVGLEQGGVGYADVQLDSPTIGDLGVKYGIKSIPTLLAFVKGEPRWESRVTDVRKLEDEEFLKKWIEEEARRGGQGGGWSMSGWFG